jgi:CO dehydrogenase nickel-insertion accessory protein CooC1
LLGELEVDDRVVVCDLEAGIGTLLRMQPGHADLVLVVANPTAKSIEVARRAVGAAERREAKVIVVANRVRDEDDTAAIRVIAGDHDIVVVPEEPAIEDADRDGEAPIEVAPDVPGVRALVDLASRLG